MKCKWYDAFEGACANGECPYRGDVCPTSEYPEVCKYAEKQTEIPRLSVAELVKTLRLCNSANCVGCALYGFSDCGSIINPQAADMLEKLATEKDAKKPEPKNHILTLEELKVYTGFLWSENRYSPFDCEGEPAFAEKGFIYAGNGNVDLRYDISNAYGKNWRCWLRKPTEAERRETPWAGDSRE